MHKSFSEWLETVDKLDLETPMADEITQNGMPIFLSKEEMMRWVNGGMLDESHIRLYIGYVLVL